MSKTKELFMQQRQWEEDVVPMPNYGDYMEYDYQYKNYLNKLKKKRNENPTSRIPF